MQDLIMQISTGGTLDLISIAGFVTILLIVWNMSKKFTTLENDAKTGKEQHNNDIKDVKDRINDLDKAHIRRVSDDKIERKEEIAKALSNSVDRFEGLQKQIVEVRNDVKDQSTRITQVNTKTEYIERQIDELKECDNENKKFFADWNQRIEDRVENTVKWIKEIMMDRDHGETK